MTYKLLLELIDEEDFSNMEIISRKLNIFNDYRESKKEIKKKKNKKLLKSIVNRVSDSNSRDLAMLEEKYYILKESITI